MEKGVVGKVEGVWSVGSSISGREGEFRVREMVFKVREVVLE